MCYKYGMKPSEFWNSTYRDLKKFVESNSLQRDEEYKKQIVLFDALGNKLLQALARKHPKHVNLVTDTFKSLFEKELEPSDVQSIEEQVKNLRSRK